MIWAGTRPHRAMHQCAEVGAECQRRQPHELPIGRPTPGPSPAGASPQRTATKTSMMSPRRKGGVASDEVDSTSRVLRTKPDFDNAATRPLSDPNSTEMTTVVAMTDRVTARGGNSRLSTDCPGCATDCPKSPCTTSPSIGEELVQEWPIKPESFPQCGNLFRRCVEPQDGACWIAGNQMHQQETQRHHDQCDDDRIEEALSAAIARRAAGALRQRIRVSGGAPFGRVGTFCSLSAITVTSPDPIRRRGCDRADRLPPQSPKATVVRPKPSRRHRPPSRVADSGGEITTSDRSTEGMPGRPPLPRSWVSQVIRISRHLLIVCL